MRRGRAGSLEPGAHGELVRPRTVLSAADCFLFESKHKYCMTFIHSFFHACRYADDVIMEVLLFSVHAVSAARRNSANESLVLNGLPVCYTVISNKTDKVVCESPFFN